MEGECDVSVDLHVSSSLAGCVCTGFRAVESQQRSQNKPCS